MKMGFEKKFHYVRFFLIAFLFSGVFGVFKVSAGETVLVPEGPFIMGSSEEDIQWAARQFHSESLDWYRDETPAHTVTLPAFHIDKYEVTVGDYALYTEATGKPPPREFENPRLNHPNQPVVSVPWRQAKDYCFRSEEHTSELQSRTNLVCRLLLEKKKN